ncbi:hypothetical protein Lal_00039421 [Lupinus albus]|nr:hypothetical protein Lal_00039421 [Lupinus albus]
MDFALSSHRARTQLAPRSHRARTKENKIFQVMDILGPSLYNVCNPLGQSMSPNMVACIAVEALSILEKFHLKGTYLVSSALRWKDASSGQHVDYELRRDIFRGTMNYVNVHSHLGRTRSPRDDLESLTYTLIFLLKGRLSWQDYKYFLEAVTNMRFDKEPNYSKLISLFDSLVELGTRLKPIIIDGDLEVGQNWERILINQEEDEQPKKKVRLRSPAMG